MAGVGHVSSSDSDIEEDQRVIEAAVEVNIPKSAPISLKQVKGNSIRTSKNARSSDKPSLREVDSGQREDMELQTTPEFRSHIAKKLSSFLDKLVDVSENSGQQEQPDDVGNDNDSGFKLFSTSVPGQREKVTVKVRRKRLPSSSSDGSEDERIRSVAVSGEYILAQSRLKPDYLTNDKMETTENAPSKVNGCSSEPLDKTTDDTPHDDELKPSKLKKHKHKKKKHKL